jgi:HEPN superfamily Swt1-like protein
MDVTGALRDTENALRDFISLVLTEALGPDWVPKCGVTPERVQQWTSRKEVESRRQDRSGAVEERLIYYADFYDLKTILKKHWQGPFSDALGGWKTMEVWLEELERMRDPDAHRRELLPHQKHLALGIAGEIRTRLIRYRSKRETAADSFPRMESVRDSLGNIWTAATPGMQLVNTNAVLRPGDQIDFVIAGRDPEEAPLEYGIEIRMDDQWQDDPTLSHTFSEADIGTVCLVVLKIRSKRPYRARGSYDDKVEFIYQVLPPRGPKGRGR